MFIYQRGCGRFRSFLPPLRVSCFGGSRCPRPPPAAATAPRPHGRTRPPYQPPPHEKSNQNYTDNATNDDACDLTGGEPRSDGEENTSKLVFEPLTPLSVCTLGKSVGGSVERGEGGSARDGVSDIGVFAVIIRHHVSLVKFVSQVIFVAVDLGGLLNAPCASQRWGLPLSVDTLEGDGTRLITLQPLCTSGGSNITLTHPPCCYH
mmetsp:Transcript_26820/g.52654  ORF Transcript_26820/g.52654 Transcript_26820/m.52654 type:complete len:206 (+) Transcript_26820:1107-1724(+)